MSRLKSLVASVGAVLVSLFYCPAESSAQQDEMITIHFYGGGTTVYSGGVPQYSHLKFSIAEGQTASDPNVAPRLRVSEATLAGTIETPLTDARIEVGRTYHVTVDTDPNIVVGSTYCTLVPPTGYMYDYIDLSGPMYEGTYKFRIIPHNIDEASGRAGEAEKLTNGRISWGVSLGSRPNGTSAGSLRLIDISKTSDWSSLYTPSGLKVYSRLSEYSVGGVLRQLLTPEALVDVVTNSSTEYELRFYNSQDATGSSYPYGIASGKYPYVVYLFSKPSGNTKLQITKKTYGTTGYPSSPIRTEITSVERSGSWPDFDWELYDWYESGETPIVYGSEEWANEDDLDSNTSYSYKSDFEVAPGPPSPVTPPPADEEGRRLNGKFDWGEAPVSIRRGPSSSGLETDYTYYTSSSDPDSYSKVKSVVYPGGGWEAYEYFGAGEGSTTNGGMRIHRPFGGSPSTPPSNPAANTSGEITKHWFEPADNTPLRLEKVEKEINGTLVGKTEFSYHENIGTFVANGESLVRTTRYDWIENSSSTRLKTVTRYYRGINDGFKDDQLFSIERPDDTKTVFAYHMGTWSGTSFTSGSGSAMRIAAIHGTTDSSAGSSATAYDSYSLTSSGDSVSDVFYLVTDRSTMEITVRDERALVVHKETRVWDGSAWVLLTEEDRSYDRAGFLTGWEHSNGAEYSASYTGEYISSETNPSGIVTNFVTYDASGRVTEIEREESGLTPERVPAVETALEYDAMGRVTKRTVGPTSGEQLEFEWTYDTAGRLTTAIDPDSGTTSVSYNPSSRTTTVTANGSTLIETRNLDGTLASVTGTGVVPQYYTRTIETGGQLKVKVNSATSASARKTEIWHDWLGRVAKTSRPGFAPTSQAAFEEIYSYNDKGQLEVAERTGYADTLYEYDALGSLYREGLDISNNGSLDVSSTDRVSEYDYSIDTVTGETGLWSAVTRKGYHVDNSSSSFTINEYTRLTGFSGNKQAEFLTVDADDTKTRIVTEVDRSNRTTLIKTTTDGISNVAQRTIANGMEIETKGFDGVAYQTKYDDLMRRIERIDPRTGTTTISYDPGKRLVDSIEDPSTATVNYEYDSYGRVTAIKNAQNKYERMAYDALGRVIRRWGDATHPVEYDYDDFGEVEFVKTWRGTDSIWSGTTWPSSPPTSIRQDTEFAYDAASGLLHYKKDDTNNSTVFHYNVRGQLDERHWVRRRQASGAPQYPDLDSAIITKYGYDSNTGELTSKTYNDNGSLGGPAEAYPTTNVSYTYTRLGQLKTVVEEPTVEGIPTVEDDTISRTFVYGSGNPLRLEREDLGSYFGDRRLDYLYATSGMVGRATGFQLGTSVDPDSVLKQDWGYSSSTGRYANIVSAYEGGSARTFTYGYETNSHLLKTLSASGTNFTVTRSFESDRDLLTGIETKWASTSLANIGYSYDTLGRRTQEIRDGSSFQIGTLPITYNYQYNDRGELTEARGYLGSGSSDPNDKLPNLQRQYSYDNAGNRLSANQTDDAAFEESFTPNNLNQIVSRENEVVIASGTSAVGVGVGVAIDSGVALAADRQSYYWSRALDPSSENAAGPAAVDLSIYVGQSGSVGVESRTALIGEDTQTISYDLDGNMASDGVWDYVWDSENRLVHAETTAAAQSGGYDDIEITYVYDYLGRRVQKRVVTNSSETYSRRYVYQGWNLIAEFEAPGGSSIGTLQRTYTWGLDVAGSMTATGGVGSLLQIRDHDLDKSYLAAYDGNGNVMALYNAADGSEEAVYEYSPFGELVRSTGDYADENPFRFSTKFTDDETGLVYYGHRYYSPSMGRFINRDPIGEAGGMNLYGFVGNDPVNSIDFLGLRDPDNMLPPPSYKKIWGWEDDPQGVRFGIDWDWELEQIHERMRIFKQTTERRIEAAAVSNANSNELQRIKLQNKASAQHIRVAALSPTGSAAGNPDALARSRYPTNTRRFPEGKRRLLAKQQAEWDNSPAGRIQNAGEKGLVIGAATSATLTGGNPVAAVKGGILGGVASAVMQGIKEAEALAQDMGLLQNGPNPTRRFPQSKIDFQRRQQLDSASQRVIQATVEGAIQGAATSTDPKAIGASAIYGAGEAIYIEIKRED